MVVKKLRCFGAGESTIAEMLGTMMQRGRNPLINCTASSDIITLHIIATAVWKGRLRYYIIGQLVHDVRDPQPLAAGRFAVRTWNTNAWWDDIEFGYLTGASD